MAEQSNIETHVQYCRIGLNTDSQIDQLQSGYITDGLNCLVSNFDGMSISYQNETGNVFCFNPPVGYKVIGVKNITQLNEVLYLLANPTTGHSMVGYIANNSCIFTILLDDTIAGSDLMNFNVEYPVLKIEIKTTNCSTQAYFTDVLNDMRYIDLNNLPWKDLLVSGILVPQVGQIDTNKMLVQPNFSVMNITPTTVNIGGNIIEGVYQFCACYADINSNQLTGFYSKTNPVSIFNNGVISPNFNDITNKSISLSFDKLDTTGLYDYFNLAVIKTINGITTVDFVGNFNIQSETFKYTYTGNEANKANIKLDMFSILEQFDHYDTATTLCQVDNVLVWGGLTREDPLNYQKIWNLVNVGWGTWEVPETTLQDYANGIASANLVGHHRDEVYPLEGCFIRKNGAMTPRCHIPGRSATPADLVPLVISDPDVEGILNSTCTPSPTTVPTWQVYNTGSVLGIDPSYVSGSNCPQPHQFGQMSYWESTERYPNNPIIWGPLANQPIRHHKFPDSAVPGIDQIHDSNPYPIGSPLYGTYVHKIYPIGFKVDINSLRLAIQNSTDLTQAEKDDIVGFKIMRGDRGADKSIVAKGVVYNCGHYNKEGSDYYYANYPLNDTNPDPFISSQPVNNKSGANTGTQLNDFQQSRFTFHSPDTHFYQPNGIEGAYLKLETVETGTCKAHFVKVKKNAGEKIRTKYALEIAFIAGLLATIGVQFNYHQDTQVGTVDTTTTSLGVLPTLDLQNFFPTYNTTLDILDKLSPYINYGWQYNGVGFYGNAEAVPNNGSKIRNIIYGGYITDGLNGTFGDNYPINNSGRESSVYLSISGNLPFAGIDNSRQTASQAGVCNSSTPFYSEIASYYTSIKRYLPDQYGQIFSYTPVDTGFYTTFVDDSGNAITELPVIFGGDIFINRMALKIKHPFYNITSVALPDGADVNYNQDPIVPAVSPAQGYTETGNVGYPIWYYSTSNATLDIANTFGLGLTNLTHLFNTTGGILLLIATGGLALVAVMMQLMAELFGGVFFNQLGLKITNLECNNYGTDQLWETGMAYLYAYGIPYFFCESEVNVDMRQATDEFKGNFYPQTGSDIPDEWLQEINTPIAFDNSYTYNKTYSKENKETYFSLLRPDWEPGQTCFINYNNRLIWSDTSNLEETKNNWLVYRPANLKDLEKKYGQVQAIDYLENRGVLVRYDNHAQVYNVLATVATSGLTAALGTGELFSGTPLDLGTTDNGIYGTQNKFILNTENGHIFIDAKRGQICLLRGNAIEDLAGPKYLNSKWFTNNLPFQILNYFPTVDVDNNFNGIGLTGVYDEFYHRLIITKLDYTPLPNTGLQFDGTNFYIEETIGSNYIPKISEVTSCCPDGYTLEPSDINPQFPLGVACYKVDSPPISPISCGETEGNPGTLTCCPDGYEYLDVVGYSRFCWNPRDFGSIDPVDYPGSREVYKAKTIIQLGDPNYFCNKSWTMSYSFVTNTWISWHSYQPNYYIEYEDYFQSGWNGSLNSVWSHNKSYSLFNNFCGTIYPYIIELPYAYKFQDEILQSVKDYSTVLKYNSQNQYTEPKETIYFDNVVAFNRQQCTGVRNLVPKNNNSLYQYMQYPQYNSDNTAILVTKADNFYNFNALWDILIDPDNNIWAETCETQYGNKILNSTNLNYTNQSYKKYPLRAKDCKIRFTLNSRSDIKIISKFVITETAKSYK